MKQFLAVVVAFASLLCCPRAEAKKTDAPLPIPPLVAKFEYQGQTLPVFDAIKAGVRMSVAPRYPIMLKREGITGSVTVIIVIGLDGKVLEAGPAACTHKEFAEVTVEAVSGWKYRPLVDEAGKPFVYALRQTFLFCLDKKPDSTNTPEGTMIIQAVPVPGI